MSESKKVQMLLNQYHPDFKKECIELSKKIAEVLKGESKSLLTCFYATDLVRAYIEDKIN